MYCTNDTISNMDFINDTIPMMNSTNGTEENSNSLAIEKAIYGIGIPIMMVVCLTAIVINARCLAAIKWLRGSVSPTLLLSLSLAAADLYTSVLLLLSYVFNSYLTKVWKIDVRLGCLFVAMEGLRLGGIITIVAHLTALAINHHLGIVRPLRYPGIATGRNIRILLDIIWIVPPIVFLLYIFIPQGFKDQCAWNLIFLAYFSSRLIYALFLVIPLIIMCVIYAHILWVVHVQTKTWARGGIMGGSYKHHGGSCKKQIKQRRSSDGSGCISGARQRLMVNVRAVYTTLHILGSFVLLYLPAILTFLLSCPCGCRFGLFTPDYIWINFIAQFLLICKPLTNPIIYAARMHEIKEATRRMEAALRWRWCGVGVGAADGGGGAWIGPSPAGLESSRATGTKTALCRIASNGSSQPQATATLIVNNDNDTTVL